MKWPKTLALAAALFLAAPTHLPAQVATNAVTLTNTAWVDLGPGPLRLFSTNQVLYAIAASAPSSLTVGFPLPLNVEQDVPTTSHVWAIANQTASATVITAPVTIAGGGPAGITQKVIYALGCDVILPPSGTVGANGAVTLGTALDVAYPCAWMYFPANALPPSRPAGFYYVTCASTTACTAFANSNNDNPVGSVPSTPPASPTPIVGSGVAYTTPTAMTISFVIAQFPGNSLGPVEGYRMEFSATYPNNADTKIMLTSFGGVALGSFTGTTTHQFSGWCGFRNQGVTTRQINSCNAQAFQYGSSIGNPNFGAVDETQVQNWLFGFNMAVATDYIALHTLVATRMAGPTS